eukprot:2290247-Prymnesium_polylepis.1
MAPWLSTDGPERGRAATRAAGDGAGVARRAAARRGGVPADPGARAAVWLRLCRARVREQPLRGAARAAVGDAPPQCRMARRRRRQ